MHIYFASGFSVSNIKDKEVEMAKNTIQPYGGDYIPTMIF
jgi:hypothetical protein